MTPGHTREGTLQMLNRRGGQWELMPPTTPFVPRTRTYIVTLNGTERTGRSWGDGILVNAKSESAAIDTVRAWCNVPDELWRQGYAITEIDPRTFDAEQDMPDEDEDDLTPLAWLDRLYARHGTTYQAVLDASTADFVARYKRNHPEEH